MSIGYKNEYALYKGEELIGIGTAKELAELTHVKPSTIRYFSTPAYYKRVANSRNAKIAVKLGKE